VHLDLFSAATETLAGTTTAYVIPIPGTTLAGMPYPRGDVSWEELARAGIGTVLDLTGERPWYDPTPVSWVGISLEDLAHGGLPDNPNAELERLRSAVRVVAERRSVHGVLVHCYGGRGRTGTVVGAYLVQVGYSPDDVAAWLNALHRRRGRPGWPESNWQRDALQYFR
jgi:hypothetical protein